MPMMTGLNEPITNNLATSGETWFKCADSHSHMEVEKRDVISVVEQRFERNGHFACRLGVDGIRRQDLRVPLTTGDGTTILLHYDTGLIRSTEVFLQALADGSETKMSDQYMRAIPEFIVGGDKYAWLNEYLFVAEGRLAGPKEIEYAMYRIL